MMPALRRHRVNRSLRRSLPFLLLCTVSPGASGQTFSGRVYDEATGALISQVHVAVLPVLRDSVLQSRLAPEGEFVLELPAGGQYRLRAEALGYATLVTAPIRLDDRSLVQLELRLRPDALALQPLRVVARRVEPWYMRDLRRRQEAGWGRFLAREDLDERTGARLIDVLAGIPGLSIRHVTDGGGASVPLVTARTTDALRECYAGVYVNGIRQFPTRNTADALDRMREVLAIGLGEIEAIEAYRGLAELPAEFSDPGTLCGAIAIWLRTGHEHWGEGPIRPAFSMRLQAGGGTARFSGGHAPRAAMTRTAGVHWGMSRRVAVGLGFRHGRHDMTGETTAYLTASLDPALFVRPEGSHPMRIISIGVEPRVALLSDGAVRPVVNARIAAAERTFAVDWRGLAGRQQTFTSYGWALGAGAGVELRPASRFAVEAGVSGERLMFAKYGALERGDRPTAARWNVLVLRVTASYAVSYAGF
jgi:hypothetical protein